MAEWTPSLDGLDRRLDDVNDRINELIPVINDLNQRVTDLCKAMNQNGRTFQDLAKEFNRQTTYFNLLVEILGHNGTIDADQFAAAQKALDREVMNQLLKNNITEEEDGQ